MLARPTLKKPNRDEADEAGAASGQTRPTDERFLLKVDSQAKRSFSSKEAALTAGSAIKKAYPVVVVSIEDTKDGATEIVNA